jgi:glycosyltransferase involved in cell wall biosynthesis
MSPPDVSIVIPTYNRLGYLRKAIDSCMGLSESDIEREIIVVDDGSTDGTQDYLAGLNDPQVRPIFQGDKGPQEARNRGLNAAKGEYVKFLDDDDWLEPEALEREIGVLRQTDADISYGRLDIVDGAGRKQKTVDAPPIRDLASSILDGTLLTLPHRFTCRRMILDEVRWDRALPCRQDLGFFLAVALQEPRTTRLDHRVGFHRMHDGERVCKVGDEGVVHQTHVQILLDAVEALRKSQSLCTGRAQSAALGLWRRAHMISAYDWNGFEEIYDRIFSIAPNFRPPRGNMLLRISDATVGPRATEFLISPFRN